MSDEPTDRPPVGSFGERPVDSDGYMVMENWSWRGLREGAIVRFMSDDTVRIPLWSERGLIFGDRQDLIREWAVSDELAADIEAWGDASQKKDGPEMDIEAVGLIRRLSSEIGYRFTVVYHP